MVRAAVRLDSRLVVVATLTIGCGPPQLGEGEIDMSTTTSTFLPDVGGPPPAHCDPFAQDCPEGEKCVPSASTGDNWDENKCVPVLGDQAPGEPCHYDGVVEATDDCDASSYCWYVMDGGVGTCVAVCLGTADTPECPPNSSCTISADGGVNVCIPSCDPLVQDCDDGLGCYWAYGDFNCLYAPQAIPAGQPCGDIDDCAAGLECLTAEVLPDCQGAACCSGFCNLELGDAPCEALLPGTVCSAFFEENMAPPGYEQVGVCILLAP